MPRNPLTHGDTDNDPLSLAQTTERSRWSLPSQGPGVLDVDAELPPSGYDYSGGVFVDRGLEAEADAVAPARHPGLIRVRSDVPKSFEAPHEATHRRFEPPRIAVVAQAAAGYSLVAPVNIGLHYIKILAAFVTLDAAGTLTFVQGGDGVSAPPSTGNLTGAMNLGGASAPPLLLPPAKPENPWLYTSADEPLGIVTATGKANGWIMFCYSPYDY